uniref:Uncharacterized protein n=1 Tax=Laurenciella marilzae TaxID=1413812 RepID=A0A1Z1M133_9FLOR|nr:hypothetical protein [Laurenciella marilzae]ARW59766.1 hypothetical protein [Laurenciella marilzae]
MTFNLRNIDIDKYNENNFDDNTESYMYNYNTEEVEISNNSSYICLNETINFYTECNKKIMNSDIT